MGEGYWVVRTYRSGRVGEKIKFWVPGPRPERVTRRARDEVKKQEQNAASAEKTLARLLNANFQAGDILLGLDYAPAGMARLEGWLTRQGVELDGLEEGERAELIRQAAERELSLCLRRVRRAMGQAGEALRYVAITSDLDGDTGELVRVHHHLVIQAGAEELFREKWRELGGVSWSHLWDQRDYTPVAAYLLRQVRRVPDAKKYISSRNLIRPQPRDRIAATGAEIRPPRGTVLLFRSEYRPGQPQYIRYAILPEEDGRRRAGERMQI